MTMITHVDIYEQGNSVPIHSVKLNPPQEEDSPWLERIWSGLIRNMRDDCYLVDREEGK